MSGHSRDDLRSQLFGLAVERLTGSILELGSGRVFRPGRFGPNTQITATDLSPKRIREARRLTAIDNPRYINFVAADAARLPFVDSSFDAIVASFVFCSVANIDRVGRELARVAKPGASIALLEHVRSENAAIGLLQDLATPAYRFLCKNCHLNRHPQKSLEAQGFVISDAQATQHYFPWLFLTGRKQP